MGLGLQANISDRVMFIKGLDYYTAAPPINKHAVTIKYFKIHSK